MNNINLPENIEKLFNAASRNTDFPKLKEYHTENGIIYFKPDSELTKDLISRKEVGIIDKASWDMISSYGNIVPVLFMEISGRGNWLFENPAQIKEFLGYSGLEGITDRDALHRRFDRTKVDAYTTNRTHLIGLGFNYK